MPTPLLPGKKASLDRLVGRLSFTEVRTGRLERGHGVVVIVFFGGCEILSAHSLWYGAATLPPRT